MLTLIYLGILMVLCILVLWNMFQNRGFFYQIDCALLLIPFLLRLLLVK